MVYISIFGCVFFWWDRRRGCAVSVALLQLAARPYGVRIRRKFIIHIDENIAHTYAQSLFFFQGAQVFV